MLRDVVLGLIKATVFGFIISLLVVTMVIIVGGARGVGIATTYVVVVSSMLIIFLNYYYCILFLVLIYVLYFSLSDVRIAFHGHEVLKGINLNIAYGESLVILGESGSGKSVLTKTILGLIIPISGKVIVDGVDVKHNKSLSKILSIISELCII